MRNRELTSQNVTLIRFVIVIPFKQRVLLDFVYVFVCCIPCIAIMVDIEVFVYHQMWKKEIILCAIL